MKINKPKNNRNIIYVMPRQSGKTARAVESFMKDPENSAIILENARMVGILKDRIPFQYHGNLFINTMELISRRFKHIILDDLQSYTYERFRDFIPCLILDSGKITIYTTSTIWEQDMINHLKFKIIDKTKECFRGQIELYKYLATMNTPTNYAQFDNNIELIKSDIIGDYKKVMRIKQANLNYLLE